MLIITSEILAIFPYFLRSLRIKKIFKARDIYCDTGILPKEMIRKCDEFRVVKIFLFCLVMVNIPLYWVILSSDERNGDFHIYSYNSLHRPAENNGTFDFELMKSDYE